MWLRLDRKTRLHHNLHMEFPGHIQNGVVVFDDPASLPEGAAVTVTLSPQPKVRVARNQGRVAFPLVSSSAPGSVRLTNSMIGEILDKEDASS